MGRHIELLGWHAFGGPNDDICAGHRVRRDHWKGMSAAQKAAVVAQQAQQAAERKAALQVRCLPACSV